MDFIDLRYIANCYCIIVCIYIKSLLQVTILSVFSGLSCVAGGIADLMYYVDNDALWSESDGCSRFSESSTDWYSPTVCRKLIVVRNTEITSAVS